MMRTTFLLLLLSLASIVVAQEVTVGDGETGDDAAHFTDEQRLELKRAAAHGDGWFFVDLDRGRLATPPFPVEIDRRRLPYFVVQPKEEVLNAWLMQNGIDLILYSHAKPLGDGTGAMNQDIQIRSVRTNLRSLATGLQQQPDQSWTWTTLPQEIVALFERKDEITHVSGFIPDSSSGEVRADSPVLRTFRTAENVVGLFLLEQPQSPKDELSLRIVHVVGATTPLADVEFASGDVVSGKVGPAEPPGFANPMVAELPDAENKISIETFPKTTNDRANVKPLLPAPPELNELDVLHEKFKLALPRNWAVHRQDRAFEFRGPNGLTEESKSEQARITLWFSNLSYDSRTLLQRDPQLPRVISWGNTRLGQVLSIRNQSAIEHWPEFGDVLYWLLPVEHVAIVGVVELAQKIDGRDSLMDLIHASGSVIDLRIDDDGRRVHNRSRALGEYGISPKTDLVILGKLPKTDDAGTEREKEISDRHQTHFNLATKGAGEYGVRIASLEDYIAYLRKLKQDGRVKLLKASKDGDGILIPEVPVQLAAQVASKRPGKLPIVYEGVIDDVLDGILLFADGRGIMTGRSTTYARLTEAGEIPAERKNLKFRTRVRYEVVPGVGATKIVILSERQDGSQQSNATTASQENVLAAFTPQGASEWGDVMNGLRARVVPVLSSMSEDAIDLAQRVENFEKPDDVAFAVELKNVSDKPITLLDTRYGNSFGDSIGKANSNWYGQFLFSLDLFDLDGKRIDRPELEVVTLNTILGSLGVATVEPGKTHRFLLRPSKWLSVFQRSFEPGNHRVEVRYHGMPPRVVTRIKEYKAESPVFSCVAGDVVTPPVTFEVSRIGFQPVSANKNEKTDKLEAYPTLVWGEPTSGLRAAMSFAPSTTSHAHGEKPKLNMHVQNVSDAPITVASQLWMSKLSVHIQDEKGERVDVGTTFYTGSTPVVRVTLKPQQIAVFYAGNIGLAINGERAGNFEHVTNRRLVAPAGKYSIQLSERFGSSFLLKDGKGKVLAPLEGDYVGELKTGVTPFEITNEAIKLAPKKKAGPKTLLKPAFRLPGHYNLIYLQFDDSDRELVAVSSYQRATVRRCNVVTGTLISEVHLTGDKQARPFAEESFKLSGDGRRVVAATDEHVGIWDTSTGELLKKMPYPTREGIYTCSINKLDCTPDLSVIAGYWEMPGRTTLVYDAQVMIWDGASGELLRTVVDKDATTLQSIDLSTDGKRLATTNGSGAKVWDTSTGQLLRSFENDNKGRAHSDPEVKGQYNDHVWSVQLSPDGKQLAVGDILGVSLWGIQTGELQHLLDASYRYGTSALVYSKDGHLLARTGTSDKKKGVVPIWSTRTGEKLFELQTEAHCGAFSDDIKQFAVGLSERKMALAVFQLSGAAADPPIQPSTNVNTPGGLQYHHRGKKAQELIDRLKPVWGDEQLGVQYGIAIASEQRQFRDGQRVPMMVFFRNVSDKPLQVDVRPDFFWDVPNVTDPNDAAASLERVALLGNFPVYREKLQPGEAFGAIYLSIGLGKNPRPGRQDWAPYWKTPVVGQCQLKHTVAFHVAGLDASRELTSDDWKSGQLTTGTLKFQVVDGGQPNQGVNQPEPESTSAVGDSGNEKDETPVKKVIQFRLRGGEQAVPLPDIEIDVMQYKGSGRERVGRFRTDEAGTTKMELPQGTYRVQLKSEKELPYLLVDKAWNKKSRGAPASLLFSVSDAGVTKWDGARYVASADSSDSWQVTFTLLPACELVLRAIDVDTDKRIPGVEFFRENAVGEDWAHPIPGKNLGWSPLAGGTKFGAAGNSTNRDGIFRRLVSVNAGFTYGVWKWPDGYEEVEPRREVEIDIIYGQRKAEQVFKLRRTQMPDDAQRADNQDAARDDAKALVAADQKPESRLVPGSFGGVAQFMQIDADDCISYSDAKSLCQMTLLEDDRLKVVFHNEREIGTDVTLPLVTGASGQQRAVWSAEIDGYVYRVTSIPFSTRGCLFRLEKRRDGKLVDGSVQFFAVKTKQGKAEQDASVVPIDDHQWGVDQSGTGIVAGSYAGASQQMKIADDRTITYSDRPHGICHLSVLDDNRLTSAFRDSRGMPTEITLPLVSRAAEQRACWSAKIDGHTLRATAIPYSDTVYVFRLEKYLDDKLVEGEEQFYAIDQKLRKATAEEKECSHAANERQ
ncbi:WD40 repeat domain-containing protein [Novipirellula sp. SH528]|uniref:WD40 repeat domain-containing protein n=1 Tax=Novipirellula sp. SH528 TaxID=3454466 RepID=UPI003FA010A4